MQSAETIRKQELEAVKSTRDDDSRAAFDAWYYNLVVLYTNENPLKN